MKTMDSLGRLTIPKEVRSKLDIKGDCDFQILAEDDYIKLVPANKKHNISDKDMTTLRKLYIMLKKSGLLDNYYTEELARITKQSESKCSNCGENMFLTTDNTFKCFNCE